jgi:hypothetical protein
MRHLQKLPIANAGVLLLPSIPHHDAAEGLQFETVELVVLDGEEVTSSYLLGHPSKRTLKTLVWS